MKRYILTGGIASGKSTVVSKLESHGIGVVDADKISHEVFREKESEIQKLFNTPLEGVELRQWLGKAVFRNEEARTRLEKLMHPLIWEEMDKQAKVFKDKPFIYDIPIYFERSPKKDDDYVILVYVNRTTQFERLKKRNDLTDEEAMDRINSQMSVEEKFQKSHFIIDNNGGLDDLDPFISKLVEKEF